MSQQTRPLCPPFNKTNENGRYWAKTDDLGKMPSDLVSKLAASLNNPGGEWIEYQGYYYRTEASKDGKGKFFVQKSKEELDNDKNRQGGFKSKFGGPRHPTVEAFDVATTVQEVNALIASGFQPVWGDNGLQVGTFAKKVAEAPEPDVVNGLFMVKHKKAD